MKVTFAHISDFHMNGYRAEALCRNSGLPAGHFSHVLTRAALCVLDHVADEMPGTQLLLMTGDMIGRRLSKADRQSFLDAIDRVRAGGTQIVFCTGSHDHRDAETLREIKNRCALYHDAPEWRTEKLLDLEIHMAANAYSAGRIVSQPPAEIKAPAIVLAHRPEDLRWLRPSLDQLVYAGCGHNHELRQTAPFIPGSVPGRALSVYLSVNKFEGSQPTSLTLTDVRCAGVITGEITDSAVSVLFAEALVEPCFEGSDVKIRFSQPHKIDQATGGRIV